MAGGARTAIAVAAAPSPTIAACHKEPTGDAATVLAGVPLNFPLVRKAHNMLKIFLAQG